MHLLAFIKMYQPGTMFRLAVIGGQCVFATFFGTRSSSGRWGRAAREPLFGHSPAVTDSTHSLPPRLPV